MSDVDRLRQFLPYLGMAWQFNTTNSPGWLFNFNTTRRSMVRQSACGQVVAKLRHRRNVHVESRDAIMRLRAFVAGVAIWSLMSWVSYGQVKSKSDPLSIAGIQKKIKAVQDSAELPASVKEDCLYYLQKALERIEIAEEQIEIALNFERRLSQIADAIPPLEQKLAALPMTADPSIANVTETDELKRAIETREKLIDDPQTGLRKQIADLEQESEVRRIRPEEILTEVTEIENRLREIDDENDGLSTSGESKEVALMHQLFLQARRQRAENELRALRAESEWFQSSNAGDYLQLEQELAAKTLALKNAELGILQKELAKRRGDEADQRVRDAESALAKVGDELKPIAETNLELAKELKEIAQKLKDVEHRHESTASTIADLTGQLERVRHMVEGVDGVRGVGLTDSIGLLLRQQRAKLLDPRMLRSNLARRSEVVRETRMRLFQLDQDRASLIDLDAAAAKKSEEIESAKGLKSVAAGLRNLLAEQRQLLNAVEADYTRYFKQLIQMDLVERDMLKLTLEYADYVDERVLWIRTGPMFGREHLKKSIRSIDWLIDQKSWQTVVDACWIDFYRYPLTWAVAGALFLAWIGIRPLMTKMIRNNSELAARGDCRNLGPTIQSVMLTIMYASGWPLVLWFIGWRLDHSMTTSPFAQAVTDGLKRAATFICPLEILRVACFKGGLAERHFGWPLVLVDGWRRNVSWFLPIGAALVMTVGLIEGTGDEHRLDASGRLGFLAFAAISAFFSHMTIRRVSSTPLSPDLSTHDIDVWSDRFWRFAPRLAVLACLGLFVLCWSGYFYTALQLTWRFQRTAWLVVGLVMLRATIRRWIALERRRMAILQDAELMTIAESGREPAIMGQSTFLFPRWHWPDFRLNLTQIVGQMRSLFDIGLVTIAVVGIWFVWADVTPALNILDRWTLWETTVERTQTRILDKERGPISEVVKKPQPVTAADMGLAFLIVGISVIAGRNIPGLIEVILLEHLSVDAGVRFAATCLVRYAIFIAGVVLAFAQISIGWSNVQWLVAAASVGLGFGLQEIFGNFVSGIILLFERPMRVGDVITIGDTTGTVSRIRFRATTIVDGDRKELIVPNKEFITGKLLNWTLSDRVNRVGVKVVVSGDNDPQRVRAILLDIAANHPRLLKDPAPSATLEEFNGGLTFMLRAFLPNLDGRSSAIHDLYSIIHDRFRVEGIEMPCPRQEVRVRMDSPTTAAPPSPHQTPGNGPAKPVASEYGSSFRRA